MSYYVYILRCLDGSFYVGSSQDLEEREKAHNDGQAASFTRLRRPVTLIYSEAYETEALAVRRERQIKKWSRAKKEALISGGFGRLKQLSKRRG